MTAVRTPRRPGSLGGVLVAACIAAVPMPAISAQATTGRAYDVSRPPGANYDKADFRLWVPDQPGPIRGLVVLVPGSNGDGRPEANDAVWQAFAARHQVALVACQFTDKPHDLPFIEEYVDAGKGSGRALLDALEALSAQAGRPEIAGAPLLLWGMSAGGQFNYEFVAWKPERVLAFVVNKGGIYYTALAPRASRAVPGMLFTGEKDLWSRNDTIAGLFAVNRRAGALWALAEEPSVAHVVGRSRDVAMVFFEEVIAVRLDRGRTGPGRALAEREGHLGDPAARTFRPAIDGGPGPGPTAWLPTERVARAWQALVTGQAIEQPVRQRGIAVGAVPQPGLGGEGVEAVQAVVHDGGRVRETSGIAVAHGRLGAAPVRHVSGDHEDDLMRSPRFEGRDAEHAPYEGASGRRDSHQQ